jgi:hypothetical protein
VFKGKPLKLKLLNPNGELENVELKYFNLKSYYLMGFPRRELGLNYEKQTQNAAEAAVRGKRKTKVRFKDLVNPNRNHSYR